MLSHVVGACRLTDVNRIRFYRQSLAAFGTKAKDGNYNAKKKKAIGAQQSYGTPKTGLILNSNTVLNNAGSLVGEKQQSSKSNQGDIFSPLLDETNPTITLPPISQSGMHSMSSNLDISLSLSNDNSLLDISSMYDEKIHLPLKPDFSDPKQNYEPATPLGDELMKYIGVLNSPITVAEYMRRCLRDEKFGYYTNPPKGDEDMDDTDSEGRGHRLIGQAGDFTTAPEISQIFGECLTIWLLTQYEALGKPSKIQLVELGPGRGTLMCDILRSAKNIKGSGESFINALVGASDKYNGIHFVEVSENMRTTQREALETLVKEDNCNGMKFEFTKWSTKEEQELKVESLVSKLREKKRVGESIDEKDFAEILAKQKETLKPSETTEDISHKDKIPVQWHDNFPLIPHNEELPVPTFIIAQEFMDALPVHVFQKYEGLWREQMVDVVIEDDDDSQSKVRVQMRDGTIATTNANKHVNKISADVEKAKRTRFRKVLSSGVTPALKSLLRANDDGHVSELDHVPDGTIIEICPEALTLAQDIALRIDKCEGAALIIDYGEEGSRDSLRAFKKHAQVDIMSSPGAVDITADVDFAALKNAVNRDLPRSMKNKTITVEAFGPKSQGEFLASMGAVERAITLIEDEKTTDEQAEELCSALERLVAENEMGQKFKVLSIARKKSGIFPPPGFS